MRPWAQVHSGSVSLWVHAHTVHMFVLLEALLLQIACKDRALDLPVTQNKRCFIHACAAGLEMFVCCCCRRKEWRWVLCFLRTMLFVGVFRVHLVSRIETVSLLLSCDCPKIRSDFICVINSGKVLRYFLCVCVCAPLRKCVCRNPIFVDIWSLLIIPQSINKSQTHILSCLSCAASLLQCVMSKKRYQLFKVQIGGCFLWVDTGVGPLLSQL